MVEVRRDGALANGPPQVEVDASAGGRKGAAAEHTLFNQKHEDLLIQRNHHVCKHDQTFVESFKKRYLGADLVMMDTDCLHFDIDN